MTEFEFFTLGLQGIVLILILFIAIVPFLILSDLQHSIEDIKASLSLIRDGKFPSWESAEESLKPAKKGDVKFYPPRSFQPPFEL